MKAVGARCGRLGGEARKLAQGLPLSPQRELLIAFTDYLVIERAS